MWFLLTGGLVKIEQLAHEMHAKQYEYAVIGLFF